MNVAEPMSSPTIRLAQEIQAFWLSWRGKHKYDEVDTLHEAWKELADAYNYLRAAREDSLAIDAAALGDEVHALIEKRG